MSRKLRRAVAKVEAKHRKANEVRDVGIVVEVVSQWMLAM